MTGAFLATLIRQFLFPASSGCPLCGRPDPDLGPDLPCRRCRAEVTAAWTPEVLGRAPVTRCRICGRSTARGPDARGAPRGGRGPGLCADCRAALPAFVAARSSAPYTGPVRAAIRRLKYSGQTAVVPALADLAAPVLAREGWLAADALVPVPLHERKIRARGYNQAELLAREVGRRFSLPVLPEALARTRETAAQARRGRRERLANMVGAFAGTPQLCAGKTLVLVDDVFTTGSTAEAAARALLQAGAARVLVLTVAAGR